MFVSLPGDVNISLVRLQPDLWLFSLRSFGGEWSQNRGQSRDTLPAGEEDPRISPLFFDSCKYLSQASEENCSSENFWRSWLMSARLVFSRFCSDVSFSFCSDIHLVVFASRVSAMNLQLELGRTEMEPEVPSTAAVAAWLASSSRGICAQSALSRIQTKMQPRELVTKNLRRGGKSAGRTILWI